MLCPKSGWYCPSGHTVITPPTHLNPGRQSEQFARPATSVYVPARHTVRTPIWHEYDASHSTHADCAVSGLYWPGAHVAHALRPGARANVVAGHAVSTPATQK